MSDLQERISFIFPLGAHKYGKKPYYKKYLTIFPMKKQYKTTIIVFISIVWLLCAFALIDEINRNTYQIVNGSYRFDDLSLLFPVFITILGVPAIIFNFKTLKNIHNPVIDDAQVLDQKVNDDAPPNKNKSFRVLQICNLVLGIQILAFALWALSLIFEDPFAHISFLKNMLRYLLTIILFLGSTLMIIDSLKWSSLKR